MPHTGRTPSMYSWTCIICCVAVLLVVCGFAQGYPVLAHSGHDSEDAGGWDVDKPRVVSPETAKHIGLKTSEVQSRRLSEILELSGRVRPLPDRDWRVIARVPGRIISISKRVGETVAKGELLACIESPDMAKNILEARKFEAEHYKLLLEADRANADAKVMERTLHVAELQAEYSQNELTRFEASNSKSPTATIELAHRLENTERTAAEVRIDKMQLELYGRSVTNLMQQAQAAVECSRLYFSLNGALATQSGEAIPGLFELRSLADGIVIERFSTPGEWINAGQAIMEIADLKSVQVEVEVPESLIQNICMRKSDTVRVRTPSAPFQVIEGKAGKVSPRVHPTKRTAVLFVDAPNPDGILRDEMWVDLAMELSAKNDVLAVPKASVVIQGPQHFVFVKNGDAFEKQDIDPGLSDDDYVEIKAGLAPGDVIVTQGAYSLAQLRPKSAR